MQEAGRFAADGFSSLAPGIAGGADCFACRTCGTCCTRLRCLARVAPRTAVSQIGWVVTEILLTVKTFDWNSAHGLTPPNSAVQATVLDGLGNVLRANGFLCGQIGNRARHLQDSIVRAGAEPQALHCSF